MQMKVQGKPCLAVPVNPFVAAKPAMSRCQRLRRGAAWGATSEFVTRIAVMSNGGCVQVIPSQVLF